MSCSSARTCDTSPNSSCAARSAASRSSPRASSSSTRSSKWNRSSSSTSPRTSGRQNVRYRRQLGVDEGNLISVVRSADVGLAVLCRLWRSAHHSRDRGDVVVPGLRFRAQRAAAGSGEAVELGALSLLRRSPLRLDPPALLHAVERRVESAVEHAEASVGSLANEPRHGIAVHRAPRQRPEDENVESALEELELARRHTREYSLNI